MKLRTIALGLIIVVLTPNLHAATVFSDGFNYGGSDIQLNVANATGWTTSSSTLLIYDADAGLNASQMNGEAGGALGMPGAQTGQLASKSYTSYAMSNLSAGDTLWMAALVQYASGTANHELKFLGGTVTELGFNIDSAGTLQLWGSDNGAGNAFINTGTTGITSGTYLVLARATKGTGTSPVDSIIDLWFNPSNTSSVGDLGSATFSTGADSKFGRDSQALSSVTVGLGSGGAMDEIRLATAFSELNLASIPEPSAAILVGLGALLLLRRRRN